MAYSNINKPSDYFNTKLYTGNGTTQSVTGVGFQPDWSWLKCRSIAYNHRLYDSVRGALNNLQSNSTAAEAAADNGLSAFNSDGFTVTQGGDAYNQSGETYVSWNWLAANGTASNTQGSIASTVSANTTSGFSIVTYTGNGSAGATIGHGLGVKPSMMIVKRRDAVDSWGVWHKNLTSINYYLRLDATTAEDSDGSTIWNSTEPTSSLITVGTSGYSNASSGTYVNYCFAEKKGFSKFGSYTGNNSSDGTFVYTGFKPAWVLFKRSSSVENWSLYDNKRLGYNPQAYGLRPNINLEESAYGQAGTAGAVDFVSNGFKIRESGTNINSGTYIYMAFAENPLVAGNYVPTTAR